MKPDKLTPKVHETIFAAIADGNSREIAATLAGISESTFYNWIAKGKEATRGKFYEFYKAVEKAEAYAVADRVKRIKKAGKDGDWKADAWWLERMRPQDYARKDRVQAEVQHSGKIETEQKLHLEKLTDEELTALEQLIKKSADASTD